LFIAAAESGAVIAPEATDEHRRQFRIYGRSLGLAYQAFDDVLDQACDDQATGKTTGRDGGKTTAVLGRQGSLGAAQEAAHAHLDKAVAAVGPNSGLASLAEFIRAYFTKTIAA
jgi:geranylgeranyl pyrophosphate synthase